MESTRSSRRGSGHGRRGSTGPAKTPGRLGTAAGRLRRKRSRFPRCRPGSHIGRLPALVGAFGLAGAGGRRHGGNRATRPVGFPGRRGWPARRSDPCPSRALWGAQRLTGGRPGRRPRSCGAEIPPKFTGKFERLAANRPDPRLRLAPEQPAAWPRRDHDARSSARTSRRGTRRLPLEHRQPLLGGEGDRGRRGARMATLVGTQPRSHRRQPASHPPRPTPRCSHASLGSHAG